METVNNAIELFPTKGATNGGFTDNLDHFFFTTGGLARTDSWSGIDRPVKALRRIDGPVRHLRQRC